MFVIGLILYALWEVFVLPRLMVKWNKDLFFALYHKELMDEFENEYFDKRWF